MLEIIVPALDDVWDEEKNEFITTQDSKEWRLQLEHSLLSLSKWESKWHKPFFQKKDKTLDELIDYIKCMTITKKVPNSIYDRIARNQRLITEISDYINDSMTATTFRTDISNRRSNEIITAEVIYYWMIAQNIPVEFERWHINRLLTLIRVCNVKNAPGKKMSKSAITRRNAALNEANRKKYHTKG